MRRNDIPWKSVEELIVLLIAERDLLTREIEALQFGLNEATNGNRAAAVLCHYIVTGNARIAAHWANGLGWRLPGATPKGFCEPRPREWTAQDVLDLIDAPPPELQRDLALLAGDLLYRTSRRRSWD